MRRIPASLLCFLLGISALCGQVPQDKISSIENILEEITSDESSEAFMEDYIDFIEFIAPFNINDSSLRVSLLGYGILNEVQFQDLENYISRYGRMLHIFELGLLESFSRSWIEMWAPLIVFEEIESRQGKRRLHHIRAETSLRCREDYSGESPTLRSNTRFKAGLGKSVSFGGVLSKGERERFFSHGGKMQAEHLSAYIRIDGSRFIRQLIIGDYRIQGGIGLRYGEGWSAWDNNFPLSDAFQPYRILARATSISGTSLKGVAVELRKSYFRLNASSGLALADGYLSNENGILDWHNSSSGVHSTIIQNSLRESSRLYHRSLRLGIEREWIRFGLTTDLYRLYALEKDERNSRTSISETFFGFDVQMIRKHQSINLEGSRSGKVCGIAFSWINATSGWLKTKIGGRYQQGSIPYDNSFTLFGDADSLAQTVVYASINASWGMGWKLALGVRSESQKILSSTMERKVQSYVRLDKDGRYGNQQSIRMNTYFEPNHWDPSSGYPHIGRIRLRYLLRFAFAENAHFSGGAQLSFDALQTQIPANGIAWYASLNIKPPIKWIENVNCNLALHSSDNANTRSYFWFPGAEGRSMMQSLYNTGWRAGVSCSLKASDPLELVSGITYRFSENTEGEQGEVLECGLRLIYLLR